MRRIALAASALLFAPALALANPCGFEEAGRAVIKGYPVGGTAIPKDQVQRLTRFAETAKARFEICVFAQVDKQGSDAANERVAKGRAGKVRDFLVRQGVKPEHIRIALQEEAVTFFGLLPSDQDDDRRVVVTHE